MTITASQVSELRQLTGCGMMECKKALEEAQGNFSQAQEILRKKGIAKAINRAQRVTSEGIIAIKVNEKNHEAIILEVNSETDFVARDHHFQKFVECVADIALNQSIHHLQALMGAEGSEGKSVDQLRQELMSKVGENINIKRVARLTAEDLLGVYVHGSRLGALVAVTGGNAELAKDLAMQVVASNPRAIRPDDLPKEIIAKEKEIFMAQTTISGKPQAVIEKIVEGRLQKFFTEVCLLKQPFIKNPDISIEQLLKEKNAIVTQFIRFELGGEV